MIDPPFHRPPTDPPRDDTRICLVGHADGDLEDLLRSQGHVVDQIEPGALAQYLASSLPNLVIVDGTGKATREETQILSDILREANAEVLLIVGEEQDSSEGALSPDEDEEDALRVVANEVVHRPLDIEAVADRISSLAKHRTGVTAVPPPPSSHRSAIPETIGVFDGDAELLLLDNGMPPAPLLSYPPISQTSSPPGGSSAPPGISWSSSAPQPLGAGLNMGAFAGPTSVSAELEKLLADAERRVLSEANISSDVPSPEAEVNAILPPEVLAALDDPLEVEDDESVGDAEAHTPVGRGTSAGTSEAGRSRSRVMGTETGDILPAEPVTAHGEQGEPGPAWESQESRGPRTYGHISSYDLPLDAVESPVTPIPEQEEASRLGRSVGPSMEPRFRPAQTSANPRDIGGLPTPIPPRGDYPPRSSALHDEASSLGPHTKSVGFEGGFEGGFEAGFSAPLPKPVSVSISVSGSGSPHQKEPGLSLPEVLSPEYDGLRVLGVCIASRVTATVCFEYNGVLCRAVMRDGDFVTCGSSADDESLLAFLMLRGDLPREVGTLLIGRIPPFGRHAAAALIANGFLGQDQLWGVLRAHAEWLLGRMASTQGGACALEIEPQGRLRSEPAVFGGATGAEVLVEVVQRVLPQDDAVLRIGGLDARLAMGNSVSLLTECAMTEQERTVVEQAPGRTVREVLDSIGQMEFAPVLVALKELGVLEVMASVGRQRQLEPPAFDPLDAEAIRKRIAARLAVIQEGDYFEVLGVTRSATAYEIRRAYLESRRAYEPAHLLTAQTADLADDARLIVEVLDEAYELLRDSTRRERYRRAIEAEPPRI